MIIIVYMYMITNVLLLVNTFFIKFSTNFPTIFLYIIPNSCQVYFLIFFPTIFILYIIPSDNCTNFPIYFPSIIYMYINFPTISNFPLNFPFDDMFCILYQMHAAGVEARILYASHAMFTLWYIIHGFDCV